MNNFITELEQRNIELERELKVAVEKYRIIADTTNCGLWEYDIKSKRLKATSINPIF